MNSPKQYQTNTKISKWLIAVLLLFFSPCGKAQQTRIYDIHDAKSLTAALEIINKYSGEGGAYDDTAQMLIYKAVQYNQQFPNDTISYYLQIWQTEIFYYAGLYQFGIHSADLQIEKGYKVKDSFLIASGYFFKAINLLELDSFALTKNYLDTAIAFYPLHKPKVKYRKLAYHNQLINVYAENYFEQKKYDSALYYNYLALAEAYAEKSIRGIPAAHLVQGKLFLELGIADSAIFHFNKTVQQGLNNKHEDLVLRAYGKLMVVNGFSRQLAMPFLLKGQQLIDNAAINNSFKTIFYKDAIVVCKKFNDLATVEELQNKLLALKEKDTKAGNELVQNITTQMVNNENNLLKLQVEGFEKNKKLKNYQLLAILLISAVMLLIFFLMQRKNRVNNKLLQQKTAIARDLHDEIGASISGIKVFSQLAADRPAGSKEYLLKVNTYSDDVITKMNDIVWTLNAGNDSFTKILERLKKDVIEISLAKNISTVFSIDEKFKANKPGMDLRKNLYLIAKEAVNNAVKYANCKTIQVFLKQHKNKGMLTVTDDGCGFNKVTTEKGNGLNNMQNRAAEINGTLTVNSSIGAGTEVELIFNLP